MAPHPKRPRDPNQLAKHIVDIATGNLPPQVDSEPSPASQLARLGGLKGGKARAEKLSPGERADIAAKAARARWAKKPKSDTERE